MKVLLIATHPMMRSLVMGEQLQYTTAMSLIWSSWHSS